MAISAALPLRQPVPSVIIGFKREAISGNTSRTCIPKFNKIDQ